MKYSAKTYAQAFTAAVGKPLAPEQEHAIIKNFLALIKKNGDSYNLKKIVAKAEKLLRAKTGKRKVIVETARPVKKLETLLRTITKKSDIIEERVNPDIIAGVRVTVNDEEQFDGSLKRKLQKLFT